MDEERLKRKLYKTLGKLSESRPRPFIPGTTIIPTGKALYDEKEIRAVLDSMLSGWLGLARSGEEFEKLFASLLGRKHTLLVNSGSSANLLALQAMKDIGNDDRNEIITTACSFPTTVNPILQLGYTPVFVDIDETLNISVEETASAVSSRTAGIVFSHTLGNPADMHSLMDITEKSGMFLLEDSCDALGSLYDNKPCGSFGTVSTFSFYASHGITMGEGGAVVTNNTEIYQTARSLRDWGRDCECRSRNTDDGCEKRFKFSLEDVEYDHRYIYSRIGYNLKPIELQAAMGVEQLKKLSGFNEIRRSNYRLLKRGFEEFMPALSIPAAHPQSDPVFFGFPIIIQDTKIQRKALLQFLNRKKIATRLFFAGNILKQPGYSGIKNSIAGSLKNTDDITANGFWIGLHQGVTQEMIEYILSAFRSFLRGR